MFSIGVYGIDRIIFGEWFGLEFFCGVSELVVGRGYIIVFLVFEVIF